MSCDVAGLGNALVDALVVVHDDSLITELGLVRGTMHLVDHDRWQEVYEHVRHLKVTFDSGGSCANTIATVGWLGGDAIYCGQVGNDQMGRMYADRMMKACGRHALQFTDSAPTGKCLSIISASDAERTMLTDLGAAVSVKELGTYRKAMTGAKVAHFTGYTLLDGPMKNIAITAMREAKEAGARVSIDAADPFVVVQTKELLWSLLEELADVVFLNADEARKLTDDDPEHAAPIIAERAGLHTVVVKLGSRGSMVWQDGEVHRIDIRKVTAVDTTGAGDAYAGGFLYGFVNGWSALASGNLASAVAAQTVAQVGAVVQDRDLLQSLIEELRPAGVA